MEYGSIFDIGWSSGRELAEGTPYMQEFLHLDLWICGRLDGIGLY